jgi:hypothetical protein
MKYLFMVIVDEKRLQAMSETEAQTLDDESLEYDDVLRKGGHFLAAQALESVNTATTVRIRNGKALVTDGPFMETKEQIGGFILVEARDLDQAIQLASHIPVVRFGAVEIRPVKELVHSSRQR